MKRSGSRVSEGSNFFNIEREMDEEVEDLFHRATSIDMADMYQV